MLIMTTPKPVSQRSLAFFMSLKHLRSCFVNEFSDFVVSSCGVLGSRKEMVMKRQMDEKRSETA